MAKRYSSPSDQMPIATLISAIAIGGFGYLRLPAAGIYIACATVTYLWPKAEMVDPDSPEFDRAQKIAGYRRHLLQPFGTKTLLGPAGGRTQDPAVMPPLRLSGVVAVLIGLAVAVIEAAFVPWEMLSPAGDGAIAFLLSQALAAGARQAADPSPEESFPSAMLEPARLDDKWLQRTGTGVVVGALVGGMVYAGLNAVPAHFGIVVTTNAAAVAAIVGAVVAVGAWSRQYIDDYNAELREHLARAEAWAERWMTIPKLSVGPPQYRTEREQPPANKGEETHRVAHFQAPAGATIEDYRAKATQLASAIGADTGQMPEVIVISPVRKVDAKGKVVPGSRQEGRFSVSWSTVDLPAKPHLSPDLDNWTAVFTVTAAFDRAFQELKLGMPDLARVGKLHVDGTPNALLETQWKLTEAMTFDKVAKHAAAIADRIGAPWLRVGRRSRDATGQPVPDSIVTIIFGQHPDRVALKNPTMKAMLDALDVEAAFHALGLGSPLLVESTQLSAPGQPELMEARFKLADDSDYAKVAKRTAAIAEKIAVPYLRMTRRIGPDGLPSPLVSIIYGCHPSDTTLISDPPGYDPAEITAGEEPNPDRLWLDGIDWDLWMRQCKLTGTDGRSPVVRAKTSNDQGVATYTFRSVPGLAGEDVDKELEQLKATSGYGYLEVRGADDAAEFLLLASRHDPLEQAYLATEYADEPKPGDKFGRSVIHPPERGKPDIDWVVGVGADGQLLVDRWEGDNPHLFVGGASGSGKSVTIGWGILQLLHNNDPGDLQLYLADPKTELSFFEDAAHVKRFIGLTTPGFAENPYAALGDMLEELKAETYRRNTLMVEHPAKPQKLSAARHIAAVEQRCAEEGAVPPGWPENRPFPWWDAGKPHPFDLPYIIAFIEECATFFKRPSIKEQIPDWERMTGALEEVARISRSAGVFTVAATQYPRKENISTTYLAQTRRIGLKMNRVGSMLTIEEPGLEKIEVPGRGMMSQGKGYVGMRALYVRAPDDQNPDVPDDRSTFLESVPRRDGPTGPAPGQMRLAAPTAMADAPPSPDGLWVAHGATTPAASTTARPVGEKRPPRPDGPPDVPQPATVPTGPSGFVTAPPDLGPAAPDRPDVTVPESAEDFDLDTFLADLESS